MNSSTLILLGFLVAIVSISAVAGQCENIDMAYGGHDILVSGRHNTWGSWEECQISCQHITECKAWTWFETSDTALNHCELKTEAFALPVEGAISGPREC